ncbi:hypothetical protein CQW23_12932 [Capsicum baccatum]|uniref:Uncharacterized protein n=1 Tax=Capsicum baccatum TaxID=33114 RepID=A0A2G2WU11_CAPBA|nr:hypothetical protein CQW23_12932 [Capsicum baccatum]
MYSFDREMPRGICIALSGECPEKVVLEDGTRSRPETLDGAKHRSVIRISVGFGGNGATMFFLIFAILAAMLGIISKLMGGNHLRAWRNDSLAAAGSSAIVAWAVTALAFGSPTNSDSRWVGAPFGG